MAGGRPVTALVLGLALAVLAAATAAADEVAWLSYEEMARQGPREMKPAVVFFTAPWCPLCKKMLRLTFADPDIAATLDQGWLTARVDATAEPGLAEIYQVRALPFTAFLDRHGRLALALQGYLDSRRMALALEFVGQGHHRTTTFEQYERSRESR